MTKDYFQDWKEREALAEAMIPLIGKLYRDHNVVTTIYGQSLINRSVIDILKAHKYVRQIESTGLSVRETLPILERLASLDLGSARIDIGKLALEYQNFRESVPLGTYVDTQVESIVGLSHANKSSGQDVVLYGFGRIGRLVARILVQRAGGGSGLNLRAIVVRKGRAACDLAKRASLLRRDSIHGPFLGTISVDEERNQIYANGIAIQVIYSDSPDSVNYEEYGIRDAIVVDNTGIWRDEKGLSQHLECPGVSRVLLTAPGKSGLKNVVYGVNHRIIQDDDRLISAASCTTNAITPVLKALNDRFTVEHGHVETVHSFTNDQNLIDNYHSGSRRGRSAAINMVITETGAAKAVAKALPELAGKLTGSAIRVPTPNVSMAILNLGLKEETKKEALNEYLREIALHSDLQKQVDYVNSIEVVSSDFVGNRYAGIIDSQATIVDGNRCVVYVWYDNEYGYSCQLNRILQYMSGTLQVSLPVEVEESV